jgi:DNA-binding transcriptional LysR family regulator
MTDPRLTLETSQGRADWADYRVFGAVVRHGGFSAAARALGMNQAGISRRVRDLEVRLNVKLLDRTRDGVTLTEAGELVFDHIVSMEHAASSIEKLVMDRDRRAEGRVVLSVPDGVGAYLLAPYMGEFLAENPAIRLSLDCGLWRDVPVSGRPEIILQFEPPTDPELVAEPIAYGHWCVFAAQKYVDMYGKPASLPEAASHRTVDLTAYGKYNRDAFTTKSDAFLNLRTVNVETNSSAVMFLAVVHGAGVAPLPTYALSVEPDLVMVGDQPLVSLPLWMCHHRDLSHSARIRRVEEWLRAVFDARKQPWFRKEFIHPNEFMDISREQAQMFKGAAKQPEPAGTTQPMRLRSSGR